MSKLLDGKKVIVTGGSSGIGRGSVLEMVKEGATVCAIGRNKAALEALQQECGCSFVVADLTADGACETAVASAVEQLGGLTTLVNCAGILRAGTIDNTTLASFNETFAANTKAVFEMMQHAIPQLKKNEDGTSIINVSSVNGMQSFGGVAAYCASKAAVDMLTKCAAVDLAPFKIRANCVNPGLIVTPLQKTGGMSDEAYEKFLERSQQVTHPLALNRGALPQPGDVGELIAFLASDKAKWITGDTVKIDAGRTCLGAR